MSPAQVPQNRVRGPIIAIGGAEDKIRERRVLRQICHLGGGERARIAVIPTASSIPEQIAGVYARVFSELGVESVKIFNITARKDASEPRMLEDLERSTLIFFSGGDQLRLASTLGGTPLAQLIRRMNASGTPVAGTSAGAGVLCQHMIAGGRSGQVLGRRMVHLAPGLGLTNRIVIDQHFSQRYRMGRLFTAVAMNPFLVGVGIDEDTAVYLNADNCLTAWGRGSVTVVDGMHLSYTDVHEVEGKNPCAVLGMSVHVLTAGSTFDLISHHPEGPSKRETTSKEEGQREAAEEE